MLDRRGLERDARMPSEVKTRITSVANRRRKVCWEELIAAAVEEMERESWEWVPSENRRQPSQDDEDYEPPDVAALHAEMQKRITAIEEAIAHLPNETAGIGHNNPPEPIEDAPLEEPERSALAQALGAQGPAPSNPRTMARLRPRLFHSCAASPSRRVRGWRDKATRSCRKPSRMRARNSANGARGCCGS
jgi:hypothetical protein